MKKVKIMMLSFIVLAVIGGALAFKAKVINPFCTVEASFYDPPGTDFDTYYCEWDANGTPIGLPGAGLRAGTKDCAKFMIGTIVAGIKNVCMSTPPCICIDSDDECLTLTCPNLEDVDFDQ